MEHQILRRKLLEEHKTFQSAKEEEECPRNYCNTAQSIIKFQCGGSAF